MKSPIVSTAWLAAHLEDEHLLLLDTSMNKVVGKEPIVYPSPIYIPQSQRFDLENVFCNLTSSQSNAFPTQTQFNQAAQQLGINNNSTVVLYDNQGIYSSPRAWWIFKAMGFDNVFILDGGLPQWQLEQRVTVSELKSAPLELGDFIGTFDATLVCDSAYIESKLTSELIAILDARSSARFSGKSPEPRAGVRSGHIPSSINLPFAQTLDNHCFKNAEQLAVVFSQLGVDNKKQIILSCGSGITACIIMVAAHIAGHPQTVLYDGSWSDWGSNNSLPIEHS